ncbi:hypothetical protein CC78DRAFT_579429 [Lojkania enalia]|uniref:Uncharacterized protein n=1 Tax=Lojkania enalia TaxID=147567 RepID=A0A9P4N6W9_9PLEO|nr:hypothetical protein CC78DRAFT_579429 [Didymosphaeria enalia]
MPVLHDKRITAASIAGDASWRRTALSRPARSLCLSPFCLSVCLSSAHPPYAVYRPSPGPSRPCCYSTRPRVPQRPASPQKRPRHPSNFLIHRTASALRHSIDLARKRHLHSSPDAPSPSFLALHHRGQHPAKIATAPTEARFLTFLSRLYRPP